MRYTNSQIETLHPLNTYHCMKQINTNNIVCNNILVTVGMSGKKSIRVKPKLRIGLTEENVKEKRVREGGNCGMR